ncbi:hypothetical protein NC653_022249 [Populus alba x Populus x berolinensis]|uniref:Uncharacterized protein n=1 Tax=Populus alba x Populus x berolinensis TaxID=444605 RepID=A0AAD6MEA9_9ROSI|nr:hypothetical protein NC653_022249 [Populus alba x Populus x berolinensis]
MNTVSVMKGGHSHSHNQPMEKRAVAEACPCFLHYLHVQRLSLFFMLMGSHLP